MTADLREAKTNLSCSESGRPNMIYKLTLQKSLQIYKKYDIIIPNLLR